MVYRFQQIRGLVAAVPALIATRSSTAGSPITEEKMTTCRLIATLAFVCAVLSGGVVLAEPAVEPDSGGPCSTDEDCAEGGGREVLCFSPGPSAHSHDSQWGQ